MIFIRNCVVAVATILMFIGILAPKIRGIAMPTGLALLALGFLLEKFTLRRFKPADAVCETSDSGQISATATSLIVTDNWSMTRSVTLSSLDGEYGIEVLKVGREDAFFNDAIRIFRLETPNGDPSVNTARLTVDSGWLMFLNGMSCNPALLKRYRQDITNALATLSADKPMCLWLVDDNQVPVGVVVTSGKGDGEYEAVYTTVDGVLTELAIEFGVS